MSDIAAKTREIYHAQHKAYRDPTIFNRWISMIPPSYFGVTEDFFKDKTILDAGCGNSGYFQIAMHRYGVKHCACLDIGEDWKAELASFIKDYNVPADFASYHTGSTDKLPFEKSSFDFVASNGVLIHLESKEQAERSFAELARVLKPGGTLYIILGMCGGLVNKYILPAFREAYKNEPDFRAFIDTLQPEDFNKLGTFIANEMQRQGTPGGDALHWSVLPLLDLDLTVFIQNVIQTPMHLDNELTASWAMNQFVKNGFSEPRRCRRYVQRKNIRKFTAPLHFNLDHPISRILYGDGSLEYIAMKRA